MSLIRWYGWPPDPVTGLSTDQTPDPNYQFATQFRNVANLSAQGGGLLSSADFHSQSFQFQPFPFSHSLFVVPGRAVAVFEVVFHLQYSIDGDDIQDSVFVDFANNGGAAICPNVELELLTPLPALTI